MADYTGFTELYPYIAIPLEICAVLALLVCLFGGYIAYLAER